MNVRTLLIVSILVVIVLYFWNKKYYKIKSVCFEDDQVSNVTVQKGFLNPFVIELNVGLDSRGYSLKKQNDKIILKLDNGQTKTFEPLSYYESKKIDPTDKN